MEGFKNFIKGIFICIFAFGILFEALVIFGLVLITKEKTDEKETQQLKYNIPYMTVNPVYNDDEILDVFEYMTKEDLDNKRAYVLDIAIENVALDDINVYYDLSYLIMKNQDDRYVENRFMSYYEGENSSSYNNHQIIPQGRTGTIKYMIIVNDFDDMDELRIYTSNDEEHYLTFDFSNF